MTSYLKAARLSAKEKPRNIDAASVVSRIFYFWISPLLRTGYQQRELKYEGIEPLTSLLDDADRLSKVFHGIYARIPFTVIPFFLLLLPWYQKPM